jgi:hypothetical protein
MRSARPKAVAKPADAPRRRALLLGCGAAALLLLIALGLRFAAQPDRVARLVLGAIGDALGLEITATGNSEYALRGSPTLVVRNVVAREPGAATPLLRAARVYVSVPWSTVRSRGGRLDFTRIELDAPVLDVPALQHWLAARPPGERRMPTLADGLQVRDGRVDGDGWRVDGIALSLPRLRPDARVGGRAAGRFAAGEFALAFDVAAAMTRPGNDAGVAIVGTTTASSSGWRAPARLHMSAPLHFGDGGVRSARLRARASGRYESGDTRLPFAFAVTSPLLLRGGTVALAPAGLALRGEGAVPAIDARGALALGRRLLLDLDGQLRQWPAAWPALPPPVEASDAPLPFALDYLGRSDLSGPAALRLQRDDARFDARFRLPDVLAWMSTDAAGSPLPPLSGRLSAPRLEISGAQLEGVEIELDDPSLPREATP